jgi:hypothetical protein
MNKYSFKNHSGDCTIYSSLINGRPFDGICTCGYGWEQVRKGTYAEMFSEERKRATLSDHPTASQREELKNNILP